MPPAKTTRVWKYLRWLLLLPIPVVWCMLARSHALDTTESKTLDWRFQVRGETKPPIKVIYLDVDSLTMDAIGNFPWTRLYMSYVTSALVNEAKVKAIGIDFVFSDQAGIAESADIPRIVAGNVEFGKFLFKNPPVVLGCGYEGWKFLDVLGKMQERHLPFVARETRPIEKIEAPELPTFQTHPSRSKPNFWSPPTTGLIDTKDNGTRVVPAYAPSMRRTYFHIGLELARLYWGLPPDSIKVKADHIEFVRPDGTVVRTVPLREKQFLDVNWFTHWNSDYTRHMEFAELEKYAEALATSKDPEIIAEAKTFFSSSEFKDAVVLIGPVDPLLQDLAPTPLDDRAVPRVGVHGNVLMTVVAGKYLKYAPAGTLEIVTVLLSFAMALLATMGGAQAVFAKVMALLLGVGYVVLGFYLFDHADLVLPFVAPVGSAFCTSFAGLIWQVVEEQKAKGRIKGMFGTYLSPTVVERMIESGKDPELGGHDAEITAYFSDIQKFSSFSEVLPSSKLAELLNEFLTACTDIVQAEMGTLDKYIGDAVVAMFGAPVDAPDHAYRACVASQLVQLRVAELREKWRSEGDKWPQLVHNLRTRIGLNTGQCMIGNMGSRTRFNYTMMGDNVNLAARMESGAKSWGAYTMVTESTRIACLKTNSERVVFRPLAKLVVQGRSTAVPVYEIVGLKENVTDQSRECIAIFEQALVKYYARDWDAAMALFRKSADLEPNQPGKVPGVSSNPSLTYLPIIEDAKDEPPPADWDGRYVMKEK